MAGGGFASTATLRSAGIKPGRLTEAVARGRVLRVRRGWYALPGAGEDALRAVHLGGRITCTSLLGRRGLWIVDSSRLHVVVPRNACRLRSTDGVIVHWGEHHGLGPSDDAHDSIPSAILNLVSCVPPDDAIVTLDSALNSGLVAHRDLETIRRLAPPTKRPLFDRVDAGCASGLETRVRLAFQRRGHRVRTQVPIAGVGRVDVLIGDRLVIETDGARWHTDARSRAEDYRRDLELVARGYLVIRLSYTQVMVEWAETERRIMRRIRANDHLWTETERRRLE